MCPVCIDDILYVSCMSVVDGDPGVPSVYR